MQDLIKALLDLDDVNRQRQILAKRRLGREDQLTNANGVLAKLVEAAEAAQSAVDRNDALIRQYQADLQRCEETIEKLRGQQMQAESNKAYLACVNGIENARVEKKLRMDSLAQLGKTIEALRTTAETAKAKVSEVKEKIAALEQSYAADDTASESEAELDRIYHEKRAACDEKALAVYERLVKSGHPKPLMKVDGRTRATPMGNCISTSALEQLRLGQLVTDPMTNAILYVDEG